MLGVGAPWFGVLSVAVVLVGPGRGALAALAALVGVPTEWLSTPLVAAPVIIMFSVWMFDRPRWALPPWYRRRAPSPTSGRRAADG